MSMFDTVKTIIDGGAFNLNDISERVKKLYAIGDLSEDEMTQLLSLAQEKANPDLQLPDVLTRLGNLELRVAALEGKMNAGASEDSTESTVDDEWPSYVQPTSKDGYYHKGDKMTFTDGKHYTCVKNNVANGPDVDPKSWQVEE